MRNVFRRLLPRRETYLLFARGAGASEYSAPTGVALAHIARPADPGAEILDRFCTSNGFSLGWAMDMLDGGAQAVTAIDSATGALMGMGWLTTAAFHVEEIDHTLDPAGGVYLFGDFVAPDFRGRGLQRLVLGYRLALLRNSTAYTIIRDDNVASIKSYRAAGLAPTTLLTCRWWLGGRRWRCRAIGNVGVFERRSGNRLVPVGG